jgi:hypothetical protein
MLTPGLLARYPSLSNQGGVMAKSGLRTLETNTVHQLKISIREIRPLIWRRILVPSNISLAELHKVFQLAMPWLNYHMYQFIVGSQQDGDFYGIQFADDSDFDREVKNDKKFSLADIAPTRGCKFFYEYDFGDDWFHDVRVEKVLPADPDATYPICVAGERCAPPEDCGGPWGYADLLKTLANPKGSEYKEMKVWAESLLGHRFDPEYFDLDRINRSFQKYSKVAKGKWTRAKPAGPKTVGLV